MRDGSVERSVSLWWMQHRVFDSQCRRGSVCEWRVQSSVQDWKRSLQRHDEHWM